MIVGVLPLNGRGSYLVAVRYLRDLASAQLAVLDVSGLASTNTRRLIAVDSAYHGRTTAWEGAVVRERGRKLRQSPSGVHLVNEGRTSCLLIEEA